MIRATVKGFERFTEITKEVDLLAQHGLEIAAGVGVETAKSAWNHAGIHELSPFPTEDGFASGVAADYRKRHIAHFHDHGTLGHFKYDKPRDTKRPRKRKYSMLRPDGEPTGIAPKKQWRKARAAGRRALVKALDAK